MMVSMSILLLSVSFLPQLCYTFHFPVSNTLSSSTTTDKLPIRVQTIFLEQRRCIHTPPRSCSSSSSRNTACWAKRRRKRKDDSKSINDNNNSDDYEDDVDQDESSSNLPDFDFVEGGDKVTGGISAMSSTNPTTTNGRGRDLSSSSSVDVLSNTQDLLKKRNRDLEKKLSLLEIQQQQQGNKNVDPSSTSYLPSMVDYIDSKKKKNNNNMEEEPAAAVGTTKRLENISKITTTTTTTTSNSKNRNRKQVELPKEKPNFFTKFLFGDDIDKKDDVGTLIAKVCIGFSFFIYIHINNIPFASFQCISILFH